MIDIPLRNDLASTTKQLRLSIGTSVGYGMEEPPPFIGGVYRHTFWLYKRRTLRNSYAPVFYGRIVKENNILKIQGFFAVHPGIIIAAIGLAIYAFLSAQPMFVVVLFCFLSVGVPLFLISAGDQQYITSFLQEHFSLSGT